MGTIMLNGIAYGGDNFFRLTQAEYDALTPYEQTHGNYCITDAGATGDLAGNYVTYTSGDVADVDATSWSTVQPMESREGFAGLFNKISTMAKNVRYLYKIIGTTDLSAISDGTVTGAISNLNTRANNMTNSMISGSNNMTFSGGTTNSANIIIPPGKWLVFVLTSFPANTTGYFITFYNGANQSTSSTTSVSNASVGTGNTSTAYVVNTSTSNAVLKLNVWSSVNASGSYSYYGIKLP